MFGRLYNVFFEKEIEELLFIVDSTRCFFNKSFVLLTYLFARSWNGFVFAGHWSDAWKRYISYQIKTFS